MSNPQQTTTCELRWNTAIEWTAETVSNGMNAEIVSGTAAPQKAPVSMLTFYRAGAPILKFEVGADLLEFLRSYRPDLAQRTPNPAAQGFLALLREHRILVTDEPTTPFVTISLYTAADTIAATWQLAAERALAIDVLVGDEAGLADQYEAFVTQRPNGCLVGFVKLYPDLIEAGPLRFPYEKALPTTRTPVASHYGAWPDRLQMALGLLRDYYAEGVVTTQWNILTTTGARLNWQWEEAKSPYRVFAQTMSQLSESVPFFHWRAQVEGEVGAGGVGTTVVAAEFSARCEAWERYSLSRPDLALSAEALAAEELRTFPGVHFDYLRRLARPIRRAPAWSVGWRLTDHRPVKVPTEWIYFNGHNSVANSNGAAFGTSLSDAVYGAKIEVVERHLLMHSYLQFSHAREFTPEEIDPSILAFLNRGHRRARFYHLGECNRIHAVVCIVGADLPPYASIGCAGKSSLAEATKKALYEAVVTDSQWSRRIEQLGPKQFISKGLGYLTASPHQVGFEESAWYWAARADAEELLHKRFHTGEPPVMSLDEDSFVAVDIGKAIVPNGFVVKVIHPDALPLPSCFAQAQSLFERLQVSETLTIPMF